MKLAEVKEILKDTDRDDLETALNDYGEEVVESAVALDIPIEDIDDCYQGEYDSDEDFAERMMEDTECSDIQDSWLWRHIDWESVASDLMYDYCEHNGHYFRNC